MGMTRKEAARVLECGAWWDHLPDDMSDADINPLQDALDVALAAPRCDWVDAEKQPPHGGGFVPRLHEERRSDHRSVLLTLRD